jgi:hypothetical protein
MALSNGFWAASPGFEVDEEVIYIIANMFSCAANTFSNSKLWIVKKSDLSYSAHENFSGYQDGTYMPAEVRASTGAGAGIGTYLLSAAYSNQLSMAQIKNPSGIVSYDRKYLSLGNIGTSGGLSADQKGSTQKIAAGDWRSYDAVYNNNSLWVVISRLVGRQPTAIWVQVDVSNWAAPRILQLDYISGEDISPGTHTFYPSVAVNKDGVAAFGFSASGSNIYAGSYFTWRRPTDTIETIRPSETIRAGVASYFIDYGSGRNRWGDYTGISVDPANENCLWGYSEFAGTSCYSSGSLSGCWTTVWSQFCLKTAVQPVPKPTIPVPKPVRPAPRPTIPVPKPIQPVSKPPPKPTISTVLFVLDLKTDDYGSEASWKLADSVTQKIIAQKPLGSCASKSTYKETASLAAGKYLFTISDSESDGICCDYGNGSYNVTAGGLVFKIGGVFSRSESTPIVLLGVC